MALLKVAIIFTLLVSVANAMTTLQAVYNMGGVTGKITFTQQTLGGTVTINLDLLGLTNGNYQLELHEYRVNFDTTDMCSDKYLGANLTDIGTVSVTSGTGTVTAEGIDLSGTRSIEGRSFLIKENTRIQSCATIEADADYITAFAHLPAELGGTVIFRQQDNSEHADTFMYLNLYVVGTTRPQNPLKWQINRGIVMMDTTAKTDISNRCGTTIQDLYNPDNSDGIGCTQDNHANCTIGDLSAKHGDITLQESGNTMAFYGDLKLPLSGENSIIGKTLVFLNGSEYYACANIVQYPRMAAVAKFSAENVTGSIMFDQKSPLDVVNINVNLKTLLKRGGGYHVHEWPVPQQVDENEPMCDSAHVGGHFNPLNIHVDALYPKPTTATPDKYEVGDISGKFGELTSKNSYEMNLTDPNLQLFGKNSIVGRSLVIHKTGSGDRWICASIWPTDDIPMITAYARFTYPVIGYMVFRQPKGNWFAETQIYVEVDYATTFTSRTVNHNWHVHVDPVGDDMLSQTGRCQSVAGHYNPYAVDLDGDYNTACNPDNPFRCELGDLSGKHGKLSIRTQAGGKQKYFFTDISLPLSGHQTIIGRSITIHDANAGGGRLSCADVKQRLRREARVSEWSSAEGQRSPSGTITFAQDAINILTGVTKISVSLSGLNSEVAGYHVHEYPTSVSTPASQVCQSSDVGGHLNPFGGPPKGPAVGTLDEYEIGDLSGKFNSLSGAAYSADMLDWTLPMSGPYSIVGRSIVIHKNDAGGTRWACGNIKEITPDIRLVEHRAEFTGDVDGYIRLSQYVNSNGDTSNTMIEVNLHYNSDPKIMTTGHNWHVHENRKTGDCASCGDHYNPFLVNMDTGYSECSMSNPLRCEVGDQSSKVGQYDIGSGKRFYTDVNLDMEGKYSAQKRSIVIHASNGARERIACANLIPYGPSAENSELAFKTVDYTTADIETKVALFTGTDIEKILVVEKSRTVTCTNVDVYFLGEDKKYLKTQFDVNLRSNNHNNLGKFAPDKECSTTGSSEAMTISFITILLCLCLSKLRVFS